jgi:hypothetical protein
LDNQFDSGIEKCDALTIRENAVDGFSYRERKGDTSLVCKNRWAVSKAGKASPFAGENQNRTKNCGTWMSGDGKGHAASYTTLLGTSGGPYNKRCGEEKFDAIPVCNKSRDVRESGKCDASSWEIQSR